MKKKKNIRSLYGNIERVNASCDVAMKKTVCEEYLRSVSEEDAERFIESCRRKDDCPMTVPLAIDSRIYDGVAATYKNGVQ